MNVRTTRSTVTFTKPFRLDGFNENQPPGDYRVDIDEELIEGVSFLAYRRIAALFHLPALSEPQTSIQVASITPATFDAMLEQDSTAI
ncbi:hypothetical protein AB4037_09800 [Labrys sp. KB_33_2]|uniref:hypothetical protein n=1 Tax=Labrys sp. KB_33_2 TaxID=3237479 RepID=UPI003F92184A